jgi:predicted RNA binding protein YcfA (HicA-like mRNA interferase family)
MPKLGIFSGREIEAILREQGFHFVRQRGSHRIMQKQIPGSTITVPIPDHREIRIGTLKSIIKLANVPQELFMK